MDDHRTVNGIHYLTVNSMSYYWVGEPFRHARYSEDIEAAHPYLSYTVPYDTPLYTVVTIRPEGELVLEGRTGAFVPPTPEDLGLPASNTPLTASISDRTIPVER